MLARFGDPTNTGPHPIPVLSGHEVLAASAADLVRPWSSKHHCQFLLCEKAATYLPVSNSSRVVLGERPVRVPGDFAIMLALVVSAAAGFARSGIWQSSPVPGLSNSSNSSGLIR